jgi:hypothetical protein
VPTSVAALVASLYLPVAVNWWTVAPAGNRLLVTGSTVQGAQCVWLYVRPETLSARRPAQGDCMRMPAAQRVVPEVMRSRNMFKTPVRLRIGGRLGPVVFRYEDASDTRPQYAYYGDSLWAYDVATTQGPQLFRFSATTGKLLQALAMPKLYRPVLAANADGLWLSPAPNGGLSAPGPAAVFLVAPGSSQARVVHVGGRAALWIVAAPHSAWVDVISGTSSTAIWRFDGARAKATRLARPTFVSTAAAYGAGAVWSLDCGTKRERVMRIDGATGAATPVATIPLLAYCGWLGYGVTYFRGAVYFLNGPKLFRVSPR